MPFKKDVYKYAKQELEKTVNKLKEAESTLAIINKDIVSLRTKKSTLCTYIQVHDTIDKKINS
jgi:tetraacyldisaccharide-1-P 4'-kinase